MDNLSGRNRIAGASADRKLFFAVASGKGGVGKSVIAFNLADHLSADARVLLIDGDFQTGNLSLLANVEPQYGWQQVCLNRVSLPEAVVKVKENLDLLASTGGVANEAFPDILKMTAFLNNLRHQAARYDYVIIDTASGILPHTSLILQVVDEVIIVTTPELTSISDTYALYKILTADNSRVFASLLVNHEDRQEEIEYLYEKFVTITDHFLGHSPAFLGSLGYDRTLVDAIAHQKGVASFAPDSLINKQFTELVGRLMGSRKPAYSKLETININAQEADIRE